MGFDSPGFWVAVGVQVVALFGFAWRMGARFQELQSAIKAHAEASEKRAASTEKALDALVRQDVHRVELDALRSRVERLEAA